MFIIYTLLLFDNKRWDLDQTILSGALTNPKVVRLPGSTQILLKLPLICTSLKPRTSHQGSFRKARQPIHGLQTFQSHLLTALSKLQVQLVSRKKVQLVSRKMKIQFKLNSHCCKLELWSFIPKTMKRSTRGSILHNFYSTKLWIASNLRMVFTELKEPPPPPQGKRIVCLRYTTSNTGAFPLMPMVVSILATPI